MLHSPQPGVRRPQLQAGWGCVPASAAADFRDGRCHRAGVDAGRAAAALLQAGWGQGPWLGQQPASVVGGLTHVWAPFRLAGRGDAELATTARHLGWPTHAPLCAWRYTPPPAPALRPRRQDPLLARSAARYMRLTIPALLGQGAFEASKRYLLAQVGRCPPRPSPWAGGPACSNHSCDPPHPLPPRPALLQHTVLAHRLPFLAPTPHHCFDMQGVVRPQSAVTLVGLALAPLYSWLFIFRLDWRLDGAAFAVDAIQVGMGQGLASPVQVTWMHCLPAGANWANRTARAN